jgi:hypothetical protein
MSTVRNLAFQSSTVGVDADNFDIYHTSVTPANRLATGISRQLLISGFVLNGVTVPSNWGEKTTYIFVPKTAPCENITIRTTESNTTLSYHTFTCADANPINFSVNAAGQVTLPTLTSGEIVSYEPSSFPLVPSPETRYLVLTIKVPSQYYANSDQNITCVVSTVQPIAVSPTPSVTATPSVTPSVTATPSVTPSPSDTPSVTATPSISTTPANSPIPASVTPSVTPSPSQAFTSFTIGVNLGAGFADHTTACNASGQPMTVYVSGGETSLQTAAGNGKAIYTNNSLTTVYNGGGLVFKDGTTANSGNTFVIDSSGFMTGFTTCGVPTPSATPSVTPSATTIHYTYLAACTGGTILGYIEGTYSSGQEVTVNGTCYVTATNTVTPSQGSLITGTPSFAACCPQPSVTPSPTNSVAAVFTSFSLGTNFGGGWSDHTTACNSSGNTVTVYVSGTESSLQSAAGNGKALFSNNSLTVAYNGGGNIFKDTTSANSGNTFTVDSSGFMTGFTACGAPAPSPSNSPVPSPSSSPAATTGFPFQRSNQWSNSGDACNDDAFAGGTSYSNTDFSSTGPVLNAFCFDDQAMTTPIPAGFYRVGANYIKVSSAGEVIEVSSC